MLPIVSKVLRISIATFVAFAATVTVFFISVAGFGDSYTKAVYSFGRSAADFRSDFRRKPADVLRFAAIQPEMTVVDLLGGAGYYTELISKLVGDQGHVYLQNNSLFLRFSTKGLEERLENSRLSNVTRLDSEFADFRLPGNVDLIFMGLSYHDIYVPRDDALIMTSREEFFPQIMESLKAGGKVLVIDHAAEPGSGTDGAPVNHRIAEDYAIEDFQNAGFVYKGSIADLRNPDDDHTLSIWNDEVAGRTDKFVLLFEKPAAEKAN